VDFLAADAHKWLLGPCGAGIFYVRREMQEKLTPPVYGWHNIRNPNFVAQEKIEFRSDARKFEAGTQNLIGVAGLVAAMELVLELEVENIASELHRKRAWLVPELQNRGFIVVNPETNTVNSGSIISFFHPVKDIPALHKKLADAGIVASLRIDRAGKNYLRLSPHFYNTDDELRRVLELLPA
jgi:selenocysteine lyase/cysteine desulfurase